MTNNVRRAEHGQRTVRTSSMATIDFKRLDDWKAFERLTADILEAEGFRVISEPSVDRSGVDIVAEEVLASHAGATRVVRWFVQCKHYAGSGQSIGRKELEEIVYCFNARTEEGLLIVTDTDIGETAGQSLDRYLEGMGRGKLAKVWNRRELENRLLRHPIYLEKYDIGSQPSPQNKSVLEHAGLFSKRILIISDSSPLSYQLFSLLNKFCAAVHFMTVWQYQALDRSELLFGDILGLGHDLILFFLGDSFGFPIPNVLRQMLVTSAAAGQPLIMFPFFAWALDQGLYSELEHIIPVRLAKAPRRDQLWLKASRIISRGDLSPLNNESFVENQYVTVKAGSTHPVLAGLPEEFQFIHSFEFLDLKAGASSLLSDTMGNPLLVANDAFDQPVMYMNSCMHNCLTRSPILSPFEVSSGYARLIENTILWTLGVLGEPDGTAAA